MMSGLFPLEEMLDMNNLREFSFESRLAILIDRIVRLFALVKLEFCTKSTKSVSVKYALSCIVAVTVSSSSSS